jgi:tetratricopeptide (TPR) repeat protein
MKKRNSVAILLSAVLSVFWGVHIASANDWIMETIELTINTRFDEAEAIINKRLAEGDSSLAVYFYHASILNSKMTHFENNQDEDTFKKAIEKVIDGASEHLSFSSSIPDQELAQIYFYRGSALGFLAYWQGKEGNWFQALDNGMASIADLEKAVELDSTLYDAYLGIGVYKYWRSTKLKFMLWLPFIADSRQEGILAIKKAIQKGRYSAGMGMHQLIYILLDFGRFQEVLPYAEEVVSRYPESQFMWWANAHTYFKSRDYRKAIRSYLRLLTLIEEDERHNPNHWAACRVRLADIYYRMQEYESALHHSNTVLKKLQWTDMSERTREYYQQALLLANKSEKALARLSIKNTQYQ